MTGSNRNTICVEDARVLKHTTGPDEQYVLRLHAPRCAARAIPGSFVHIRCAADLPMRRPLSIMRARATEGWIEVLYKTVGQGLRRLSTIQPGDRLSIVGPIGNGFSVDDARSIPVLIGGGVGIPPLVFLAEHLAANCPDHRPVAFFGSEIPFPFELCDHALALEGVPMTASLALSDLNAIGIPSRLATTAGFEGCYAGYVTQLAGEWLSSLPAGQLTRVMLYACGPEPMLAAVAMLAAQFAVPSQLCLEEFMACGVGGCAGCAVEVQTPDGPAMKRVCVDGPVFAGDTVYPAAG
ncbi:MAG: dihydroorotate dehydrogenase electron transfer subunit [Gammaproteobacteria bacterium]|nr:MAG: dihydroorotate dehydrogenase electron transfer subunit [Gammaproteobacteria bacterium]